MDKIVFQGMQFYAYHGVYPEENKLGQPFVIDVEASLDLKQAGLTDALEKTIDYGQLYQRVEKVVTGRTFRLIEALAEAVAGELLKAYPKMAAVKVRVTKPNPPIAGLYAGVAVEINRHRVKGDN